MSRKRGLDEAFPDFSQLEDLTAPFDESKYDWLIVHKQNQIDSFIDSFDPFYSKEKSEPESAIIQSEDSTIVCYQWIGA